MFFKKCVRFLSQLAKEQNYPHNTMADDNKDVLEFINSLPDSKSNTPKPDGKEDDLFEFLDELAAHDKKPSKLSPKKAEEKADSKVTKPAAKETVSSKTETVELAEDNKTESKEEENVDSANKELEIDPINTITNWWNKEGSSAVSNLWGSITTNATTLSETTYKIASDTTNQLNSRRQEFIKQQEENGGKNLQQITNITNRLNNILINITDQIVNNEDELINVIVVNDIVNLNYVNDLILKNFKSVMNQVEGGIKININNYNHNTTESTSSSVDLNMFNGKLIDGEKLCLANLDNTIKNFNKVIEFENNEKTDLNEKLKLINKSNVFISIQPINVNHKDTTTDESEILVDQNDSNSFFFLVILNDITNKIVIKSKTQAFPLIWSNWLMNQDLEKFEDYEDIDPKEWVKDWIREGLNLTFGIISQQYVIKRMGF